MADNEDAAARIAALEQENAELRAKLAERESRRAESRPQVELISHDDAKRSRFAKLMLAGGVAAILGGIFGASWFAVICGLGWLLGGAAIASTVPQSGGDS